MIHSVLDVLNLMDRLVGGTGVSGPQENRLWEGGWEIVGERVGSRSFKQVGSRREKQNAIFMVLEYFQNQGAYRSLAFTIF